MLFLSSRIMSVRLNWFPKMGRTSSAREAYFPEITMAVVSDRMWHHNQGLCQRMWLKLCVSCNMEAAYLPICVLMCTVVTAEVSEWCLFIVVGPLQSDIRLCYSKFIFFSLWVFRRKCPKTKPSKIQWMMIVIFLSIYFHCCGQNLVYLQEVRRVTADRSHWLISFLWTLFVVLENYQKFNKQFDISLVENVGEN